MGGWVVRGGVNAGMIGTVSFHKTFICLQYMYVASTLSLAV